MPTTSLATPRKQQEGKTREWLSKDEAAKLLDLSPQRVLALTKDGKPIKYKWERDPESKQRVKLLHAGDVSKYLWDREHPAAKPAKPELPDKELPPLLLEGGIREVPAAARSPFIQSPEIARRLGLPLPLVLALLKDKTIPSFEWPSRKDEDRYWVHEEDVPALRPRRNKDIALPEVVPESIDKA
jgi:hypothetical protein